ncbi:MAG: hypothetical protein EAZ87_06290 [Nostocales cyanobacterium]|nr:MAG: hypothetical protein EAZ87_06290 [Nostocales cyanobacterium]
MNLINLQRHLEEQNWLEADKETRYLLLQMSGRENDLQQRLRILDIESLPLENFQEINMLWLKYSQERFGFSVQYQICKDIGLNPSNWKNAYHSNPDLVTEQYRSFEYRIGWRDNNNNWLLGHKNCEGHFPRVWVFYGEPNINREVLSLLSLVQESELTKFSIDNIS